MILLFHYLRWASGTLHSFYRLHGLDIWFNLYHPPSRYDILELRYRSWRIRYAAFWRSKATHSDCSSFDQRPNSAAPGWSYCSSGYCKWKGILQLRIPDIANKKAEFISVLFFRPCKPLWSRQAKTALVSMVSFLSVSNLTIMFKDRTCASYAPVFKLQSHTFLLERN